MRQYTVLFVTLLMTGWTLAAAEISSQPAPPKQLQVSRLVERIGCNLEERSMVILVCSALEDGKWVGVAPCGFDVGKCTQPQWVEFLRDRTVGQRTRAGDHAPHSGEVPDSTLSTGNPETESTFGASREGESLVGKLKRIRRLNPPQLVEQWKQDTSEQAPPTPDVQWVLALQATYVEDGCAEDSALPDCMNSPYQQYLRELESDETVVRLGGE